MWELLKAQIPERIAALGDVGFWLLTGVFLSLSGNVTQYWQRIRLEREWRAYHTRERGRQEAQIQALHEELRQEREARAKDLQKAAERAQEATRENAKFQLQLLKLK